MSLSYMHAVLFTSHSSHSMQKKLYVLHCVYYLYGCCNVTFVLYYVLSKNTYKQLVMGLHESHSSLFVMLA